MAVLSATAAITAAGEALSRSGQLRGRLEVIDRYLRGEHPGPYMPKTARLEYRTLAERAVTNWLPLVVDVLAQGLYVEGYRRAADPTDAAPWAWWQANGLDARQSGVHRAVLGYGQAFVTVLPGEQTGQPAPVVRGHSPRRMIAMYADEIADDWPQLALLRTGGTEEPGGVVRYRLFDDQAVHVLEGDEPEQAEPGELRHVGTELHQLGVCPVVRFRNRHDLDGRTVGEVEPLLVIQDRINETTFGLLMAQQYAAFRQRWITGMAIPEDEHGRPIEPFRSAVDRLWMVEDRQVQLGEFSQTDLRGYIDALEIAVRHLAAVSQVPPAHLLGQMANLSAEALAAAEQGLSRKTAERRLLLGEAWEQVLRLAALAAGDTEGAADTAAQVVWRDTEARSFAATVDALGKLTQMLGVPAQALWSRVPGVSQQDVEHWRTLARTTGSARADTNTTSVSPTSGMEGSSDG